MCLLIQHTVLNVLWLYGNGTIFSIHTNITVTRWILCHRNRFYADEMNFYIKDTGNCLQHRNGETLNKYAQIYVPLFFHKGHVV